ncbi:3'-5' exonuclease [Streptomyces sp. FXJ1.4098]|nr:3'-5' exonuclease [Streptomyces sp. FXJ1.4098]
MPAPTSRRRSCARSPIGGSNSATINGWVTLCHQGTLTHKAFFDRLRDNLLSFEIQRNQQKLNINKQRNQERKRKNLESKADLVVSTIHGAKGLEFDNAVVLYREDTKMTQDAKRMFYVAFTRAMKSQYVLGYGTVKNPPIQSSYEQIVTALTERDKRNAARPSASIRISRTTTTALLPAAPMTAPRSPRPSDQPPHYPCRRGGCLARREHPPLRSSTLHTPE